MPQSKSAASVRTKKAVAKPRVSRPSRANSPVKKTPVKRSAATTKRIIGLRLHHIGGLALLVIGLAWGGIFLATQPARHSDAATGCSVSSTLVNSCRPWLGAAANNYPQAGDNTQAQLLYHESRIGKQLDIVHTYHPVGDNDLSSTDLAFAARANTYVFANWKPTDQWRQASGINGAVNADIDKMARSVRSLGSKKIFMTLNHEPENDVSGGASGCTTYVGSKGTPAEYRAMWRNVQNRFDAAGATNVVWVMDYMNYPKWDCMVDDLWPGNDLVDWVMFNGYGVKDDKWEHEVGVFYDLLTRTSNSDHDYLSKPWGIVEWGVKDPTAAQAISYYNQASDSLSRDKFPRLKAYMVFDARHKGASNGENYRVGFDDTGRYNAAVQQAYNAFANHPRFANTVPMGGGSTPKPSTPSKPGTSDDRIPPTITLSTPKAGITESGGMNVLGVAKDNIKIKAVSLRVDDKFVETDEQSPYTFRLDTTKYANGKHSVTLRAWDTSDNMAESSTVIVNFKNKQVTETTTTIPKNSTTVISSAARPANGKPIPAGRLILVTPSTGSSPLKVWVNGKLQATNAIETINLTNGTHTITFEENGVTTTRLVSVNNPFAIAMLNTVRANALVYGTLAAALLALAASWIIRPYLFGLTSQRERAVVRKQRSNYKR